MQSKETIMREIALLTLLNKAYQQTNMLINEDQNSALYNLGTQIFMLKQSLEDIMRMENVDTPISGAAIPNIPTSTSPSSPIAPASPTSASSVGPANTPTASIPQPNNSVGNATPNNGSAPVVNGATNFFDSVLSGSVNNADLKDALNQILSQSGNNTQSNNGNNAPF